MADIEKLIGSESRLEVGQKINEIIENNANTDLSNLSATGESKFNAIVPTGTVISSANSSTPTGYLYCNGSAVSRTTYSKLFSAIGTTYGTGDGSTTFNLPNYSTYRFVTSTTVSVKGNGKVLGLKWDTDTYGLATSSSGDIGKLLGVNAGARGKNAGDSISRETSPRSFYAVGVSTDASASGLTGTVSTAILKWYIKY